MWPSVLCIAFSAIALLVSLIACFYAVKDATALASLQERMKISPVSRLESCESSIESLAVEMGNLANRVKMIKVRRAADHVKDDDGNDRLPGEPDWRKDPEAWRNWKNQQIQAARLRGV